MKLKFAITTFIFLMILSNCRKPPLPEIERITPSEAMMGSSVQLSGSHLNFFEYIQFGEVQLEDEGTEFTTSEAGDLLIIKVPAGLTINETIEVYLVAESGRSNSVEFTLIGLEDEPVITIINPSAAVIGETISIIGENLGEVDTVCFNNIDVTGFVSQNNTEIKVVVPEGALSGEIVVKMGTTASDGKSFTVKLPPVITHLSRPAAPAGDTIRIFGENFFEDGTIVTFPVNATVANNELTFISPSELIVRIPVNAQDGNIKLVTPTGEALFPFDVLPPLPVISELRPDSAFIGQSIKIIGANFRPENLNVVFNDLSVDQNSGVSFISSTELNVVVPNGAISGVVQVKTTDGASNSLPFKVLSVIPTARIQVIHNSADPTLGKVDIYFGSDKVKDNMEFRTATAFIDIPIFTEVVIAPENSSSNNEALKKTTLSLNEDQSYLLLIYGVQNPNNFDQSVNSDIILDTRLLGPVDLTHSNSNQVMMQFFHGVTDLSTLSIRGSDFQHNNLNYGNFISSGLTLDIEDDVITLLSNNQEIGEFDVKLASSGLGGKVVAGFISGFRDRAPNQNGAPLAFLYATNTGEVVEFPSFVPPTPIISNISPTKATQGCNITITGDNFEGDFTQVLFPSGAIVSISPTSDEEIKVTVPANAGSGAIRVQTNVGIANSSDFFTFVKSPTITRTLPEIGNNKGGPVLIFGESLENIEGVKFGNTQTIGMPGMEFFSNLSLIATNVPLDASGGSTVSLQLQISEGCTTSGRDFRIGTNTSPNAPVPGTKHTVIVPTPPSGVSLPSISNNWSVIRYVQQNGNSVPTADPTDFFKLSKRGFGNCDTCGIENEFGNLIGRYTTDGTFIEFVFEDGVTYEGMQDNYLFPTNFNDGEITYPLRLIVNPVDGFGEQLELVFPYLMESISQNNDKLIIKGRYFHADVTLQYRALGIGFFQNIAATIVSGTELEVDISSLFPGSYEMRLVNSDSVPSNSIDFFVN